MSNLDYLNLSTDLRRIAVWLQDGDSALARKFIEIDKKKFGDDKREIGKKKISTWLDRVGVLGEKSAEDALTLSILLKHRFSS
ncbi:MAG TPA: hypothetical protein VI791_02195 [Patescibacteria group bacterium]|nr:hypothetical protein [Patescibacteria group bacterium]